MEWERARAAGLFPDVPTGPPPGLSGAGPSAGPVDPDRVLVERIVLEGSQILKENLQAMEDEGLMTEESGVDSEGHGPTFDWVRDLCLQVPMHLINVPKYTVTS